MLAPNDQRRIKYLIEQIKEDSKEFKQHHFKVFKFINEDDPPNLEVEELVCDEHSSHMMDMFSRLEQLMVDEDSVSFMTAATTADPSRSLNKRLRYLHQEKEAIIAYTRESYLSLKLIPDCSGKSAKRISVPWAHSYRVFRWNPVITGRYVIAYG